MWISINWERLSDALNSTNLKRVDTFCQAKRLLSDAMDIWDIIHSSKNISWYFFLQVVCFHQPEAQPAAALVASCPGSTRGGRAQCLTDGSGRASEGRFGVLLGDFRCWGPMNQLQRDFQFFFRGSVSAVSLWVTIATRAAALAKSPNRSQWTNTKNKSQIVSEVFLTWFWQHQNDRHQSIHCFGLFNPIWRICLRKRSDIDLNWLLYYHLLMICWWYADDMLIGWSFHVSTSPGHASLCRRERSRTTQNSTKA